MEKGKIAQVLGPVVDVAFDTYLPLINEALKVTVDGQERVMEVSKHMGNHIVRCILLDVYKRQGQAVAKSGQGNGGAGAAPLYDGVIPSQRAQNHAGYHIAHQDARGGQLCFVD